jgi:hypothetical protein
MSAMVLRTGSKTRKLTDRELIRLAVWHWHQDEITRGWQQVWLNESQCGPESVADLIAGDAMERLETQFTILPLEQKAHWITVAEACYFTVCMILGDPSRSLPEPVAEGGPA